MAEVMLEERVLEPEVNSRNGRPVVRYFNDHYGDFQGKILDPMLAQYEFFILEDLKTGKWVPMDEEHLMDKKTWATNLFYNHPEIGLYETIAQVTKDPICGYRMGRESLIKDPELVPDMLPSDFIIASQGVQNIVEMAPENNRKWNKTKEMYILQNYPGHFIMGVQHKPGMLVHPVAIDYHLGLFDAAAEIAGQLESEAVLRDGIKIPFFHEPFSEGVYFEIEMDYKIKPLRERLGHQAARHFFPGYGGNLDVSRLNTIKHREASARERIAKEEVQKAKEKVQKAKEKEERIRRRFQVYVPKEAVDDIVINDLEPVLGLKRKKRSVLLSDIRGFSGISEILSSEELGKFLNDYFTWINQSINEFNGQVDKYRGDADIVHFRDPVEAALCGIEMRLALRDFNDWLRETGRYKGAGLIKTGMGISTGYLSAGNIGTEERMDLTIIGDTVNTASRLEGMTKEYRMPMIVDEETYKGLKEAGSLVLTKDPSKIANITRRQEVIDAYMNFDPDEIHERGMLMAREIGDVRAYGKKKPEKIYELIGRNYNREVLAIRARTMLAYREALNHSRIQSTDPEEVAHSLSRAIDTFGEISSLYKEGVGQREGADTMPAGDYICDRKVLELENKQRIIKANPSILKDPCWYVEGFNHK